MRKPVLRLLLTASLYTSAKTPEEKLLAQGIVLPEIMAPVANYVNVVRTGNLLYLPGKGPVQPNGKQGTGQRGLRHYTDNRLEKRIG
jgi:enamine deaminase RidA (YjgF/YER057c/UK114 family)